MLGDYVSDHSGQCSDLATLGDCAFDLADCSGTAPSTSPTARGLVSGHADVSSVCYKVPPCCSDQGADIGQRIKGLDQYTSGSFSLTLLQDFYGVFQQAQGLHGYMSSTMTFILFFTTWIHVTKW
jgi:hypothetical protein